MWWQLLYINKKLSKIAENLKFFQKNFWKKNFFRVFFQNHEMEGNSQNWGLKLNHELWNHKMWGSPVLMYTVQSRTKSVKYLANYFHTININAYVARKVDILKEALYWEQFLYIRTTYVHSTHKPFTPAQTSF